jgi:hypothetical protein
MRSLLSSLRVIAPIFVLALPLAAQADASSHPDPQVSRLLEAKKTLNWNAPLGGSKERYGHAETLVDAPADVVAKKAVAFNEYKTFHRKFAAARVINKEGDMTDVYMRYPVTIGKLTIELKETMRFAPVKSVGNSYVLEGQALLKGDMTKGHTVITVKPVDAKHCLLFVDVLLVPKLPAPQSFIDEELRDGALDFANGLKDKAQGWSGPVTQL